MKPGRRFVITLMVVVLFFASALPIMGDMVVYRPVRLEGKDRVETAIEVARYGWTGGTNIVIVVPADQENLIDSIAVSTVAAQAHAPILLTAKSKLDPRVRSAIKELEARTVFAVGALSPAVVSELQSLSVSVEVIQGKDRWETNRLLNTRVIDPRGTFVLNYNAVAEALMVAPYAAKNNFRLVLANSDGSVDETLLRGDRIYLMGTTAEVKDISAQAMGVQVARLCETNKTVYERSWELIRTLPYDYEYVFVANGDTLVDALSVSSLAGYTGAPIVLGNRFHVYAADEGELLYRMRYATSRCVMLGGPAVLDDAVMQTLTIAVDIYQ
jgi:putative cell wall-binding protein